MSRIVSFRGVLASGAQDTIALQTNNGLIGYKITKFQIMPKDPSFATVKFVVKIYKTDQTGAIDDTVNFSDNRLLAAASFNEAPNSQDQAGYTTIIFDSEKFNQNIYVTNFDNGGESLPVNYYFELEQMKLDLNEQTVATLKDIRNTGSQ